MKIPSLLVAFIMAAASTFGQKDKGPSFGVITPEEQKMVSYEKAPNASAVILFDIGSCELTESLEVTYKRHTRIKFFTAEAIEEFATKTLNYETTSDMITRIKGSTYNVENGVLVESKLNDDGIFKQKLSKRYSQVKFTLPNVKPGSIIEYSYTWTMSVSLLPSWQFQHTIPTKYSEYVTMIPKSFTFRKDMIGFLPLTRQEEKNQGAYEKLVMEHAPAFIVEPFSTTPEDYLSGVTYYITEIYIPGRVFNLERSWKSIAKGYDQSQDFGDLLKSTGWLEKIVEPLIAGATTPEDKAKRIHEFVRNNIVWDEQVWDVPEQSLKKVLEKKRGSSGEINLLLAAMLKRAGLDAYPVLLSTRDHGLIRPFTPHASQFNDAIVLLKAEGKDRLLDATDRNLPFGSLPERCLNGEGLVVNSDAAIWVPLVGTKARSTYTTNLKLSPDGELTGVFSISRDGIYGSDMRGRYQKIGQDAYVASVKSGRSWEISKSEFSNMETATEAAKEVHDMSIRDHVQVNGDIMYLSPFITGQENNVFKSETREYPVNIPTPFDHIYSAKIEIPEGYKVEEAPATKVFALPGGAGKYVYSVTILGNTVNVTSQLTIAKNTILPADYPIFREFYAMVVAKQAEQIVVKKAN